MRKINISKIIIFIFILVVPIITFNIKRDVISEIDNKKLMTIEDIFNAGDLTNGIESFMNDRIGLRTSMVSAYTKSMDLVFDEMIHPSYQYGEDEYVFFKVSENKLDNEFQEIYSSFIKNFQEYCESRGIGFLYAVEPSKEVIYSEYLPKGYNYTNDNLEYFIELLIDKKVNFTNNVDNLLKYKNEVLLYDKEYDARHWNETGSIIGISQILKDLNSIDGRIGDFKINEFQYEEKTNTVLPNSNFKINEKTTAYNLINDSSQIISDFNNEIEMDSNYHNFTYYKNNDNKEAPRILIFAGSYFNDKEKFMTNNFSEIIKVHNYRNVVNYEYYINIFNPDIVLFESTEYTHMNYYFPINDMENKVLKKSIFSYDNLYEDKLVYLENDVLNKGNKNIVNFSIPFEGDDLLYVYAHVNNRMLDCNISKIEDKQYIEFSIKSSELENIDSLDLYFISKDEGRYQKSEIYLE